MRIKKKKRNKADAALQTFLLGLRVLRDSADACPPLKSVVGGLYAIAEVLEGTKANEEDVDGLVGVINEIITKLADTIPDATNVPDGLQHCLVDFARAIDGILLEIEATRSKGVFGRFIFQKKDKEGIVELRSKLDNAWKLFNSASIIRIEVVQRILLDEQKKQSTDLQEMKKVIGEAYCVGTAGPLGKTVQFEASVTRMLVSTFLFA